MYLVKGKQTFRPPTYRISTCVRFAYCCCFYSKILVVDKNHASFVLLAEQKKTCLAEQRPCLAEQRPCLAEQRPCLAEQRPVDVAVLLDVERFEPFYEGHLKAFGWACKQLIIEVETL